MFFIAFNLLRVGQVAVFCNGHSGFLKGEVNREQLNNGKLVMGEKAALNNYCSY
jgi:hypothetical protein